MDRNLRRLMISVGAVSALMLVAGIIAIAWTLGRTTSPVAERVIDIVEDATGEGEYVYCALALWRQLKKLHPGAVRLLANLLTPAPG